MGVALYPAISQSPRGQLYGWLPLSNAYGISSGEKQPISFILRHFLALQNKTRLMSIGISPIVKKTLLFGKIDCEAIQAL